MKNLLVSAGLAIALTGCATPNAGWDGKPAMQSEIRFGPYPDNYREIVMDHLDYSLKDPESLRDLVITKPVKDAYDRGWLNDGYFYGYRTCVSYNAKNSYGAYTGKKVHTYWLRHGKVHLAPPYTGRCPAILKPSDDALADAEPAN